MSGVGKKDGPDGASQVGESGVGDDGQNASGQFPAGVRDSCPPPQIDTVSEVRKVSRLLSAKRERTNRVLHEVGSLPRGVQQSVLAELPFGDQPTSEAQGPKMDPSPPASECMFGDSDVLLIDHEAGLANEPRRRLPARRAPAGMEREDTVRREGVFHDEESDDVVDSDGPLLSDAILLSEDPGPSGDMGLRPSDELDLDKDILSIAGLDLDALAAGDNTTVAAPIPVRRFPRYLAIGIAFVAVAVVVGWTAMALQSSQDEAADTEREAADRKRSVAVLPTAAPAKSQLVAPTSPVAEVDEPMAEAEGVSAQVDEVTTDDDQGHNTPYGEIPVDVLGAASDVRSTKRVPRNRRRLSKKQVRLGLVRQRRRQDKAAMWHFERALALDPNSDEAMRHLGQYALEQGRLDDSARWAYRSVQADNKNVGAWLLLATAQERRGQLVGALSAYKEVLSLSKRHRTARARVEALSKQVSSPTDEIAEDFSEPAPAADESSASNARDAKRRRIARRRARRRARRQNQAKSQASGRKDGVKLLSFGG